MNRLFNPPIGSKTVQIVLLLVVSLAKAEDLAPKKGTIDFLLGSDSVAGKFNREKVTSVHFYSGLTRWNKRIFILEDLIQQPLELSNLLGTGTEHERYGVLSQKPTFEMRIDLTDGREGRNPLSIGLGYERFHFSQSGFLDVEKIEQGIFKNEYIGESIVLAHDLKSFYLIGTFPLKDYATRHFWGYSINFITSVMYSHLRESEEVTMQTGLMQNSSTGAWEYRKEYFSRSAFADLYSMEAGVRIEWYASSYFSLIFPQVTYRRTLYREAIPSKTYISRLDGDQLIMPERTNGLNSLYFMFGLSLHF